MSRYSVIVGNIGTIDHYPTKKAAFESVTLFDNDLGEPIKEYIGTIDNNEEE